MLSTHPMRQMPLWRDANRLLLLIEQAVRHFPRYHKYTLGTDLRHQAMNVCRLIARAYHDKEGRRSLVQRLNGEVDDLKIALQLAKELAVFRDFKEFESIAILAVTVGKPALRLFDRLTAQGERSNLNLMASGAVGGNSVCLDPRPEPGHDLHRVCRITVRRRHRETGMNRAFPHYWKDGWNGGKSVGYVLEC